jgi:glycosyltransferase involved in cell wall biosynthesis
VIQPHEELSWFSPLPPARNGIADYAAILLAEIARHRPCACYSEDPEALAPPEVEVRDPLQAFRHLAAASPILHQIGNNGGHVFVLNALRQFGGVSSLHDLSLLYVNELGTPRLTTLLGRMLSPSRSLGLAYARHWKSEGLKTAANYILFDMVGEILSRSRRVIVHSEFARKKLAAVHGSALASKIDVIPHFAKAMDVTDRLQSRVGLGLDPEALILLTSGFATKAKRFDWLIEALDTLLDQGLKFHWIHAGEERAAEYPLSDILARRPALAAVTTITGYLPEDRLDGFIAAADIVVNLRFPSVGESSGTLARAFAAERCCLVTDTAGYAEIPRDAVVHIPVFDAAGALARALDHLIRDDGLRQAIGDRAGQFARTALSVRSVARRYMDVVDAAYETPSPVPRAETLRPASASSRRITLDLERGTPDLSKVIDDLSGRFELTLWFDSAEHFAALTTDRPEFLQEIERPHIDVSSTQFLADGGRPDRIGLRIEGEVCG